MSESDDDRVNELVMKIRELAGEIGGILHTDTEIQTNVETRSDAETYDFQVQVGLGRAVAGVFGMDPGAVVEWLGYCLIESNVEPSDRLEALSDALRREVEAQLKQRAATQNDPDVQEEAE